MVDPDPALLIPPRALARLPLTRDFHFAAPSSPSVPLLLAGEPLLPSSQPSPTLEAQMLDRTITAFPLRSAVSAPDPALYKHPTVKDAFTKAAQLRFKASLGDLDPRIRAKLEQPFGKDNISQSFRSQASLRHVLLPLWKSGFLAGDGASWRAFGRAYYVTKEHFVLEDKSVTLVPVLLYVKTSPQQSET